MKNPSKRVVIKTARQRLKEWSKGRCPFCLKDNIHEVLKDIEGTPFKRVIFTCDDCKTENRFSGPSVRKLK